MTFPSFTLKVFTVFMLLFSTTAFGETVLISHDFGGLDSENLNGKTATVFSSALTSAGGSDTWTASTAFKANGDVTAGSSESGAAALLGVGSYINDHMGTTDGIFSLTATLNPTSGGGANFLSLGYFTVPIDLDEDFASDASSARATALTRVSSINAKEYYVGPGAAGSAEGTDGFGQRTYSIVLDFTPASGYGTTNSGTITFHSDKVGDTPSVLYFSSVQSLTYIGITRDDDVAGNFSNFEFTQIPEPSTFLLMVIAGMGLTVFLRRR